MKPIIKFKDYSEDGYAGEFIEPNTIIVYTKTCAENSMNPFNAVMHEYVHFFLCNHKILHWIINKWNTHVINKYNGREIYEGVDVGEIYFNLPEERLCNWIAYKFADKRMN